MVSRISALVASIIACVAISSARAEAQPRVKLPGDYLAWSHVALCESGGWKVLGSAYPDPFGITAQNWAWMGARPMPVGPVPLGRRAAAVRVADRFIRRLGIGIPDRGGCRAW